MPRALTAPEWRVLAALERGPCSLAQLAAAAACSPSEADTLLLVLELQQLVRRVGEHWWLTEDGALELEPA